MLEEHFSAAAADPGLDSAVKVVGDKVHDDPLAINLDPCADTAQALLDIAHVSLRVRRVISSSRSMLPSRIRSRLRGPWTHVVFARVTQKMPRSVKLNRLAKWT